jgi:hypothetical protein
MVRVDGVHLHFTNIGALGARADEEERVLLGLNAEIARDPRNPAVWAKVARQAAILGDLLVGLRDWQSDEEASLDALIAEVQRDIYNLGADCP